ncbi:MAG: hypothetical protein Harvfovirus14_22 [Harvfovirus sp.]|uniref:Uncharacterized protein n=1 Tax=Harvfovirus sp. TaxID=2487768 RepID=A0A3G5A4A0_9VIRU|nr:MAG: hypothetical protein Harvfovirus14_22 [Harvfovirus sp.]
MENFCATAMVRMVTIKKSTIHGTVCAVISVSPFLMRSKISQRKHTIVVNFAKKALNAFRWDKVTSWEHISLRRKAPMMNMGGSRNRQSHVRDDLKRWRFNTFPASGGKK